MVINYQLDALIIIYS